MTPQYHDTKCLICETAIHAPVEHYVCNTCHNDDYSTVADFIVKQNARIAALEADKKRLERVRIIASQIFDTVNSGVIVRSANPCPHGNFATAPYNHPWFCDDCWNALKDALSEVS